MDREYIKFIGFASLWLMGIFSWFYAMDKAVGPEFLLHILPPFLLISTALHVKDLVKKHKDMSKPGLIFEVVYSIALAVFTFYASYLLNNYYTTGALPQKNSYDLPYHEFALYVIGGIGGGCLAIMFWGYIATPFIKWWNRPDEEDDGYAPL